MPTMSNYLGEYLFKQGYRTSEWYRQPDGRLVTGIFDPSQRDFNTLYNQYAFERRYGNGSFTAKGNPRGEALVVDWIQDLIQHPSNPLSLAFNNTYWLDSIDKADLKLVRGAVNHLKVVYNQIFGAPEPIPPTPTPHPIPTPPAPEPPKPEINLSALREALQRAQQEVATALSLLNEPAP